MMAFKKKTPFLDGNTHMESVPPTAEGMQTIKQLRERKAKADMDEMLNRSQIKFDSEEKAMQVLGIASIRLGMAQAHKEMPDSNFVRYLSKGRTHRCLLDNLIGMQIRGDEHITFQVLHQSLNSTIGTKPDRLRQVVNDAVQQKVILKRKWSKDSRVSLYVLNNECIDEYIAFGNRMTGISGRVIQHVLQGILDDDSVDYLLSAVGFYDREENKEYIAQEIKQNPQWSGDSDVVAASNDPANSLF